MSISSQLMTALFHPQLTAFHAAGTQRQASGSEFHARYTNQNIASPWFSFQCDAAPSRILLNPWITASHINSQVALHEWRGMIYQCSEYERKGILHKE